MNQKNWSNRLLEILKSCKIDNPKSIAIYKEALTHKSFAHENNILKHQQRLEFLGDSAIGWIISNYLFSRKPSISEGDMTIAKAGLVSSDTLAMAARDVGIDSLILVGNGLTHLTNKVLEDSFEAFIGAIAQDQGIKKVIHLLERTLIKYYNDGAITLEKDYKTKFQEQMQSIHGVSTQNIVYKNEKENNECISKLYYANMLYGVGRAENRKKAEQLAAKEALDKKMV
ncbi:MAG: ribonuclease III [Mycoplasma sp.]